MTTAEKYVLPATSSFSGPCSLYLVIIALKVGRLEQELTDLARLSGSAAVVELLIWPALIAYGEAAVAYAGDARRPGGSASSGRGGCASAACADGPRSARSPRADGFPWGTWAGSLNLFRLVVVGVLDLGLPTALPAARASRHAARRSPPRRLIRGGRHRGSPVEPATRRSSWSSTSAWCSPGFAGLTIAAALAGLYPLAGAPAQAVQPLDPQSSPPSLAGSTSCRADGPGRAACAHPRHPQASPGSRPPPTSTS